MIARQLHMAAVLVFLLAGLGATTGCGDGIKPGASSAGPREVKVDAPVAPVRPTVPKPAESKPDYTMSAPNLWGEYHQNQKETIKKYQGKVIEVNGTINKVTINPSAQPEIYLQAGGDPLGLRCIFHEPDDEFTEKYARGQAVRVKGVWNPRAESLGLSDCVIVGR